jgi:peroxiredoxin
MLRFFSLPSVEGRIENLSQFRRQFNLVIFFHHDEIKCAACRLTLDELGDSIDRMEEEKGRVVAVGPTRLVGEQQGRADSDRSILRLIDSDGHAAVEQGVTVPSLLITDRFGEVYAAWQGGSEHQLPRGEEVVSWLSFIETLCDECTPSSWTEYP